MRFEDGSTLFYCAPNSQIHLLIDIDSYTELEKTNHFQYFSFRSTIDPSSIEGMDGPITVKYIVQNAGKAS